MSFHTQSFHQSATKGILQAVVDNLNNLSNEELKSKDHKLTLYYHGGRWINLQVMDSQFRVTRNIVTTKGKNEMLTVLNALQNYLLDVEGKKY